MVVESNGQLYTSPPITEAVIEVRLSKLLTDAKLQKARDFIASRYENSRSEPMLEGTLHFDTQSATFEQLGMRHTLSSADETDRCVLSPKSLAWTRLAPYPGWVVFAERFETDFRAVFKATGPLPISRLGLRYVNRIDVEPVEGLAHYEEFLNFRIEHGDLLEPTSGFQWIIVKDFPALKLKANVMSAVVEPEIMGWSSFAFDIDVYCNIEVPQTIDDIQAKLKSMRELKNTIFEAGITERARRMYT